jgi:hypothetical protein
LLVVWLCIRMSTFAGLIWMRQNTGDERKWWLSPFTAPFTA